MEVLERLHAAGSLPAGREIETGGEVGRHHILTHCYWREAGPEFKNVNIMAVAAATASLSDPNQVTNGRRLNQETRTFVTTQLDAMDYKHIPSQANFVMIDVKRPALPLIKALKERNVEVGRLFPALPNHMRLTIGKKAEMEAFLSAFRQVTA